MTVLKQTSIKTYNLHLIQPCTFYFQEPRNIFREVSPVENRLETNRMTSQISNVILPFFLATLFFFTGLASVSLSSASAFLLLAVFWKRKKKKKNKEQGQPKVAEHAQTVCACSNLLLCIKAFPTPDRPLNTS